MHAYVYIGIAAFKCNEDAIPAEGVTVAHDALSPTC